MPITNKALEMLKKFNETGNSSETYYSANTKGEPLKSTTIAIRGDSYDTITGNLTHISFMKNIISTAAAPAAIGPYSQATLTNGFLFVSGQIPVDPGSGNIECDDIKGQAVQSLRNMESILKEAGYTIEDVVKTTCFITDMKISARLFLHNRVWDAVHTQTPD